MSNELGDARYGVTHPKPRPPSRGFRRRFGQRSAPPSLPQRSCSLNAHLETVALLAARTRSVKKRTGDRVIVLWRFRAQGQRGQNIDLPAVSVCRLRESKIIESRMFHFDTAALLQFLNKADASQADDPGAPGQTAALSG